MGFMKGAALSLQREDPAMTDAERVEQLEVKIGQAYQVIGALLARPDGENPDFDSPGGQRTLYSFAHERYDDDFLPLEHPRKWLPAT